MIVRSLFGGPQFEPNVNEAVVCLDYFARLACRQCEGVEIYHFSSEIILGNFYRHVAIFFWSHFMLGVIDCFQHDDN